ncbi:hypothetical protein AVEN_189403-1 [Araneus ventricosus]|uniref:Uncharacterized protein n=1 Tax=Araneus ventricosus TaxID=182803 RepID=A0A4Y2H7B7_ARAVE|nr:hypothetical protein AVEN_189403-1 [Araneus ventricosus]
MDLIQRRLVCLSTNSIQLVPCPSNWCDQKALEYEDNVECFDDLTDNWQERLRENVVAQGANSETENLSPSDDVIQQVEPTMTAQQTLKQIDFIMANSESVKDVYINTLFQI